MIVSVLSKDSRIQKYLNLACDGYLVNASRALNKVVNNSDRFKKLDNVDQAKVYHAISFFELIMNANETSSVGFHIKGKQAHATTIPPLADMHLKGNKCGGLGDIFYVGAVCIKQLVDFGIGKEEKKHNDTKNVCKSTLGSCLQNLVTLSMDSGLPQFSIVQLNRAIKHTSSCNSNSSTNGSDDIDYTYGDAALLMRSVLMGWGVYPTHHAVHTVRKDMNVRLSKLLHVHVYNSNGDSNSDNHFRIKSLDEFSLSPTFYLVYQGYNDKDYLTGVHRLYGVAYPALHRVEIPPPPKISSSSSSSSSGGGSRGIDNVNENPIRIGFVSKHFRRHSICKLFCGIIKGLALLGTGTQGDPTLSHPSTSSSFTYGSKPFEVFVFSSVPSGGEDDYTRSIKKIVGYDNYIDVGMTIIQNRNLVTDANIDVLVYLDIGMDPATTAWAGARLAPIQVCVWGHPTTTGLPHMDYFISSELFHRHRYKDVSMLRDDDYLLHPPQTSSQTTATSKKEGSDVEETARRMDGDSQGFFTEQLVQLPSVGFFFERLIPFSTDDVSNNERGSSSSDSSSSDSSSDSSMDSSSSGSSRDSIPFPFRSEAITYAFSGSGDSSSDVTAGDQGLLLLAELVSTGRKLLLCPQHLPKLHPSLDVVFEALLANTSDAKTTTSSISSTGVASDQLDNGVTLVLIHRPNKQMQWRKSIESRWCGSNSSYPSLCDATNADNNKVIWLPQLNPQQYATMLSLGSVMIDPFPFGGGVTSLEGLSVCVPVVTAPALQSVPGLTAGIIETIHRTISSTTTATTTAWTTDDDSQSEREKDINIDRSGHDSIFSLLVSESNEPRELVTLVYRLLHDETLLNRTSSRLCDAFKVHDDDDDYNQHGHYHHEQQKQNQKSKNGDTPLYSIAGAYNNRRSILDWADFMRRSHHMIAL